MTISLRHFLPPSSHWPLSGFYFFYFGAVGILMPYLGLYLQSLGFCPKRIGTVIAVLFATKIVAPNIWGALADRYGRRMGIIRMASLASVLAFAGIYLSPGPLFLWTVVVMAVFGFFWNASLPQVEVITLDHLEGNTHRYGLIRLWGSVGFILTVLLFGISIEQYDVDIVPHGVLVLLIGVALSSLWISDRADGKPPEKTGPIGDIIRQPRVLALFVACFLMQLGHGPLYTFYSIYLEEHLYTPSVIGGLWTLGVCAEIVFFLVMPWVFKRVGLRGLLLSSIALACLRWWLVAMFPMDYPVQMFAQLLHAATFGVFHAASILFIYRFFAGNHRSRGQALYNSVGFGAGSAVGALGGGFLWYSLGGYNTYLAAVGVSALAFLIVWRWVPNEPSESFPGS